jgi:Cu(I)/Ag(I) efflux system membrane fusion protein
MYLFAAVMITTAMVACSNSASQKAAGNSDAVAHSHGGETHAEMTVGGSCGMCKNRIEKTVKAIDGVTLAEYNLQTQKLHIHYDAAHTSAKTISQALAKVGHDTEFDKADDDVYNALPECCHYRK